MAVKSQAKVEIFVSKEDSTGAPGASIPLSRRLMALSIDENVWYGFQLFNIDGDMLEVGKKTRGELAFLVGADAQKVFKSDRDVPFGNGVRIQGALRLEWI